MQAWILDESPGRYRWGTIDPPPLGDRDVRLRVVASALNHMDLWVTRGAPKPPLPHVPGCDVAGVVCEIGPAVTTVAVGDEVVVNPAVSPLEEWQRLGEDSPLGPGFMIYGEHCWGGHAELATAPEHNVRPRPAGRSWEECAAFGLAGLTALRMIRKARLQRGDTVLITGIGSGVSSAALSIATHLGVRAVVTSRSEAKRAQALQLGASEAFDSTEPRWAVEADAVLDSVGPATWDAALRALRPGGRMVICGGTSGATVSLNLPRLFFKQHEIIGSTMGSYGEYDELCALMSDGLPVVVDQVTPLEDYAAALDRLERGDQLGKLVLTHEETTDR